MTLGATPFSIYMTVLARARSQYVVGDAGAQIAHHRAGSSSSSCSKARKEPARTSSTSSSSTATRRTGTLTLDERRGRPTRTSTSRRRVARGRARRRPDADLHVGHDRPAEGRRAHPPQPDRRGRRASRSSSSSRATARVISWLPNAHIAERNAHHYIPIVFGLEITMLRRTRARSSSTCPQVRPSWFFAVPRIWEKLKAGPRGDARRPQPDEQREKAQAALDGRDAEGPPRAGRRGGARGARRGGRQGRRGALLQRCATMLGLDQVEAVNVGAAPTPRRGARVLPRDRHADRRAVGDERDLRRRHDATRPSAIKIGTVGPPAPGVEIKLADGRRGAHARPTS